MDLMWADGIQQLFWRWNPTMFRLRYVSDVASWLLEQPRVSTKPEDGRRVPTRIMHGCVQS